MFCILHQYCGKSVDNGHCGVFVSPTLINRGVVRCVNVGTLPEDKWAVKKAAFKRNALKQSKKDAAAK
jgi:hypothetical protein